MTSDVLFESNKYTLKKMVLNSIKSGSLACNHRETTLTLSYGAMEP